MPVNKTVIDAFFALVRGGLWEREPELSAIGHIDFVELYRLSREQSVAGLVAAGLDKVKDIKIPHNGALPFLKEVFRLENRNITMDAFISDLFRKMADEGIKAVLVKGQGVARCYEQPLWRSSGDIDLFFDDEGYAKAKAFLLPLASDSELEDVVKKHLAMTIDSWLVELHGAMPTDISERIDNVVASVQKDIFSKGGTRVWNNGGTEVLLPDADNDIIVIFTHFFQHFVVGGVGVRQICDWCRLLWTYRDSIDLSLLEKRLRDMNLMVEWRAFASFAVEYLGMPAEAMPFYVPSASYSRKARKIMRIVLDAGNFGHNKDRSYRQRYSRKIGAIITFFLSIGDFLRLFSIFPSNTPRFFFTYFFRRTKAAI